MVMRYPPAQHRDSRRLFMRAVRIDAIQIARVFAALLVVFDHALINLMSAGTIPSDYPFAFRSGGFGVLLFFVISGFVMAHSMYDTFAQPGNWKTFLARRIVRITPLYWLVTLAIAAKAIALSSLGSISQVVLSLAYIPYRAEHGEIQPLNGIGWTLNYEMQFYLIFALCLCFSRRAGMILLSAILFALVLFRDAAVSSVDGELLQTALTFWMDPIILYFLGGTWLGLLRARLDRSNSPPKASLSALVAGMLAAILTYEVLLLHGFMPRWLECVFVLSIVAALGLTNSTSDAPAMNLLKRLGDASYSTYLTHLFVLSAMWKVAGPHRIPMSPVMYMLLAFVCTNIVGLLTYKLVEKRALALLQAWIARPSKASPSPAA